MTPTRRAFHGRFVRRQICASASVAALIRRCGPWAGLLFERLILWQDDEHRFVAQPEVVKGHCLPWHPFSNARVMEWLREMQSLGMVTLYRRGGTLYGYFPTGPLHQPRPKTDRFTPSELPPPPKSALRAPAAPQRIEPLRTGDTPAPAAGAAGPPQPPPAAPRPAEGRAEGIAALCREFQNVDVPAELTAFDLYLAAVEPEGVKSDKDYLRRLRGWLRKAGSAPPQPAPGSEHEADTTSREVRVCPSCSRRITVYVGRETDRVARCIKCGWEGPATAPPPGPHRPPKEPHHAKDVPQEPRNGDEDPAAAPAEGR